MQQNLTCRDFDPIEVFFEKLFPAEMGTKMILLRKLKKISIVRRFFKEQESKSYLFNLFVVNSRGQGNVSGDL